MSDIDIEKYSFLLIPVIDYLKASDELDETFEEFLNNNYNPQFVIDFHENKALVEQYIELHYIKKEKRAKNKTKTESGKSKNNLDYS